MRRASVSVLSNIAEGFESQNDRTFARYLYLAKASSGEVRAQAYVALDQSYISEKEFRTLYDLCTEVSSLVAGLIKYLEKST